MPSVASFKSSKFGLFYMILLFRLPTAKFWWNGRIYGFGFQARATRIRCMLLSFFEHFILEDDNDFDFARDISN